MSERRFAILVANGSFPEEAKLVDLRCPVADVDGLLIQYSVYIIALVVVLLITSPYESQINLIIYWAILSVIIQVPFTLYYIKLVKKNFTLNLDYQSVIKYIIVSVSIFSGIYLLMDKFLIYKNNIFEFLPNLMLFALIGVIAYIGITYIIDPRTKKLVNLIINELKK